ncbi:MAG: polysaccharide deacetylase family protein [Desulfobacterales bacterium]|nr:polysaccharide deacetylase family protein [Desulfobacterales bacterium]
MQNTVPHRLSPALWCGLTAFTAAIGLGLIQLQLATVPLSMFVIACLAAPFLPGLGFYLPVVSRGTTGKPLVALTFDDGPDPVSTPALLALLAKRNVRATFFVIGWRAAKYPELIDAILAGGHSIGNHSFRHSYLALLRGPQTLRKEIMDTQKALARSGIQPLVFRPPVGIMTPGLGRILGKLGMSVVNFRFRTFDGGNRRLRNLARFTLKRVRPDDILVLHDLKPAHNRGVDQWLGEVHRIITGLGESGLAITPLEELINQPVMKTIG